MTEAVAHACGAARRGGGVNSLAAAPGTDHCAGSATTAQDLRPASSPGAAGFGDLPRSIPLWATYAEADQSEVSDQQRRQPCGPRLLFCGGAAGNRGGHSLPRTVRGARPTQPWTGAARRSRRRGRATRSVGCSLPGRRSTTSSATATRNSIPSWWAVVVQTAASDWAAARLAVAIERVAVALLAEEEPQRIVPAARNLRWSGPPRRRRL